MTLAGEALHVFRKDVRRFWPWLLGVGGVMAATVPLVVFGLPGMSPVGWVAWFPWVTVATSLVAALVILEDPPASDTAFSQTRPVTPLGLLAGKMLLVWSLLVLPPVLGQAAWLSTLDQVGFWALMRDGAVMHGGVLMTVVLVASLGRSWGSLPLLVVIGFPAAIAWVTSFAAMSPRLAAPGVLTTRPFLMGLAGVTAGSVLAAHHYLARRTSRTAVLIVASCLGLLAVPRLQLDWAADPFPPEPRREYAAPDAVDFRLVGLHRPLRPGGWESKDDYDLSAEFRLLAPDGHLTAMRTNLSEVVLTGSSGTIAPRTTRRAVSDRWVGAPPHMTGDLGDIGGTILGSRVLGTEAFGGGWAGLPLYWGSRDDVERATDYVAGVEVTASLDVFRVVEVGRMPLSPGAAVRTPSTVRTVEGLERRPGELRIAAMDRFAQSTLDRFSRPNSYPTVLVHPMRREIFPSLTMPDGQTRARLIVPGARLGREVSEIVFNTRFPRGPGSDPPPDPIPDDWFDEAEILVLGLEYVGTATVRRLFPVERWPDHGEHIRFDEPVRGEVLPLDRRAPGSDAPRVPSGSALPGSGR